MLEGAKEIIGNSTVNPTINKPRTPKNRSYNFGEPSGRPLGVQISGCQNHQKACQVYFEDLEGWSTFFTQSFLSVIEETGGNMSNKKLVERVAGNMARMFDEKKLPKGDSRRNDLGLYCDEGQKDFKFLSAGAES
jgi:hypothetical protein